MGITMGLGYSYPSEEGDFDKRTDIIQYSIYDEKDKLYWKGT